MTANYERAVIQHFIDLYEEGGELLALIEMIPMRDHLLIEKIAVHPDQQGKGLGDHLLRHAEGVAAMLGLAVVQLYTNAAFISNLAFYAKRGYQECRRGTTVPGSTTAFMPKCVEGTKSCQ
jgi:GNAT superfamily N-acetyltransferase